MYACIYTYSCLIHVSLSLYIYIYIYTHIQGGTRRLRAGRRHGGRKLHREVQTINIFITLYINHITITYMIQTNNVNELNKLNKAPP